MATIKELSARLAATGQLTESELAAFNAATGPNATAQAQEAALETLISKLEARGAGAAQTVTTTNPATVTTAMTQPATATTAQTATAAATTPPSTAVTLPVPPTEAEWLASAPARVRDLVQRAAAQEQAHKTALISAIGTSAFTAEELGAFPVPHLQKLAALAGVNNSNSGVNVPNPADPNAALGTLGTLGYDWSGAGAMFPDIPRTAAITEVMDPYEEALKEQRANRKTN